MSEFIKVNFAYDGYVKGWEYTEDSRRNDVLEGFKDFKQDIEQALKDQEIDITLHEAVFFLEEEGEYADFLVIYKTSIMNLTKQQPQTQVLTVKG